MWFFFFKQKTAYEMRISDWSSDVCSSDDQTADRDRLLPADRMLRLSPVAFRWQQAQGAGQRRHAAPRTQATSALVVSAGHDASDHLFHWHRRISSRDQDQQDRKSTLLNSSH